MMMRSVLVLLLGAALACSHKKAIRNADAGAPQGEFALEIVNHHFLDIRIYIVHDGERTRVGLVTAATTQRFILPGRMLGQSRDVVLVGEAVGSRETVRTESLVIKPGQVIEWTLETDLRRSSVGVY
jgi:hypothetical protein